MELVVANPEFDCELPPGRKEVKAVLSRDVPSVPGSQNQTFRQQGRVQVGDDKDGGQEAIPGAVIGGTRLQMVVDTRPMAKALRAAKTQVARASNGKS